MEEDNNPADFDGNKIIDNLVHKEEQILDHVRIKYGEAEYDHIQKKFERYHYYHAVEKKKTRPMTHEANPTLSKDKAFMKLIKQYDTLWTYFEKTKPRTMSATKINRMVRKALNNPEYKLARNIMSRKMKELPPLGSNTKRTQALQINKDRQEYEKKQKKK